MKKLALIVNVLFGAIGLLSIFVALMSVMLFDAPGSENNTYLWVLFWLLALFPVSCFFSIMVSNIFIFKYQQYKKALWVFIVPCILVVLIISSVVLIEINCGGNFVC